MSTIRVYLNAKPDGSERKEVEADLIERRKSGVCVVRLPDGNVITRKPRQIVGTK